MCSFNVAYDGRDFTRHINEMTKSDVLEAYRYRRGEYFFLFLTFEWYEGMCGIPCFHYFFV